MRVLAIDPGKKAIGLSIWDEKQLSLVEYRAVESLALLGSGLRLFNADLVVCEVPQVYRGIRNEDPNDLIAIAIVAGVCLSCAPQSLAVKPHEWKGGVPKDIHNKRTLAKLTDAEREMVAAVKPASKRHNAIDAVGIGQWQSERIGPPW